MSRTAALPTTTTPTVTFRQYIRTGEWATGDVQFALCYTDHMAKAIEYASYSGDQDDPDRYFTLIDGKMVEVEFRCKPDNDYTDADDYMHSTWGVFIKGDESPAVPIDTFHVRIDGRA